MQGVAARRDPGPVVLRITYLPIDGSPGAACPGAGRWAIGSAREVVTRVPEAWRQLSSGAVLSGRARGPGISLAPGPARTSPVATPSPVSSPVPLTRMIWLPWWIRATPAARILRKSRILRVDGTPGAGEEGWRGCGRGRTGEGRAGRLGRAGQGG